MVGQRAHTLVNNDLRLCAVHDLDHDLSSKNKYITKYK